MNDTQQDKPPSGEPPHQWLVAVIANLKPDHHSDEGPSDEGAEYDKPSTIQNIRNAIESDGHTTVFLNADETLLDTVRKVKPDICFNIAESKGPDFVREAHVPALLAMLGIPYTASTILANAVSLDKPLTKRIWHTAGLPICPFKEYLSPDEPLKSTLHFPLFVKPAREGTGMGVALAARVSNKAELYERVKWVIDTYKQPALVETFLPGREFTVAVLGRSDAKNFSRRPELYGADGFHRFPILEIESQRSATPGVYSYETKAKDIDEQGAPGYLCPADIPVDLANTLQDLAIRSHLAINALDVSRVDFRLGPNGKPYILEINTLPGLNPAISDVCIMSDAEKLPYKDLILEILYLGASRYGMAR